MRQCLWICMKMPREWRRHDVKKNSTSVKGRCCSQCTERAAVQRVRDLRRPQRSYHRLRLLPLSLWPDLVPFFQPCLLLPFISPHSSLVPGLSTSCQSGQVFEQSQTWTLLGTRVGSALDTGGLPKSSLQPYHKHNHLLPYFRASPESHIVPDSRPQSPWCEHIPLMVCVDWLFDQRHCLKLWVDLLSPPSAVARSDCASTVGKTFWWAQEKNKWDSHITFMEGNGKSEAALKIESMGCPYILGPLIPSQLRCHTSPRRHCVSTWKGN